ncbi:MAG: GGDEF domain-containing protein [Gammaproteobacteria bacterium]|nr:GGDEF domain-containing protein [Gammaproteobacteria bacterium]
MTLDESIPFADLVLPAVEDLQATQLFAGEDEHTLARVLDASRVQLLKAGQVLFEPGQVNSQLFLVLEGRLAVKLSRDSEERLNYVHPGACVGEMSVLESEPVSAFVYADMDTRLLVISDTVIWSLIHHSQALARNLLLLLSARVRNSNQNISLSIEEKRAYKHEAKIDALTGLYNRRWLDESLPRWTTQQDKLSLMMLDIDHFKRYNDSYGHLAGDVAIKSVAKVLLETLRSIDLAARYGGEEFIALLPGAGIIEAREIAERVRLAISQYVIEDADGHTLPDVTVSIGIAELKDGLDPIALIGRADAALYQAKKNGRNQVSSRFYSHHL